MCFAAHVFGRFQDGFSWAYNMCGENGAPLAHHEKR